MSKPPPLESKLVTLTANRHDRDVVGLTYVYPVVSRRAGGVSVGINLNPNNACNWRCIYCQVEGLTRGAAPELDLAQLERELMTFASAVEHGGFLEQHVAPEQRRLTDLAISGNGEPTSSPQFAEVIELLARIRQEVPALSLPVILITNGSLADRPAVQAAIRRLGEIGGSVWFKLDAGTDAGLQATNSASTRLERHLARLAEIARLCPTEVQSCWFRRANHDPSAIEVSQYLAALRRLHEQGVPVRRVQLYTLARQPQQPEARELAPVSREWLEALAESISGLGLSVIVAG
jgi:wyosine [tRNA(Phe)-imidazoG37] synthetase (radical SAM superfamily)